jgi:hypothetical protein
MRWNESGQWIWSLNVVHLPIIDRETFDQARAMLAGRTGRHAEHKPHRTRRPYALRGCVWCGIFGRRMQSHCAAPPPPRGPAAPRPAPRSGRRRAAPPAARDGLPAAPSCPRARRTGAAGPARPRHSAAHRRAGPRPRPGPGRTRRPLAGRVAGSSQIAGRSGEQLLDPGFLDVGELPGVVLAGVVVCILGQAECAQGGVASRRRAKLPITRWVSPVLVVGRSPP